MKIVGIGRPPVEHSWCALLPAELAKWLQDLLDAPDG
jgi:hypothetical protein